MRITLKEIKMKDEKIQDLRSNTEKAECFFSKKLAFTLGPVELKELSEEENVKIIDVRLLADYEIAHIPGAISMPYDNLLLEMKNLKKEDLHVIYCYNNYCHLGARAALVLARNGYSVMELSGGFKTWSEEFRFATVQ